MNILKRFYDYPSTPIKNLTLSTSGLLVLADLTTTAKRTALTGTSIWLDVFVLAPGLHYQQSAETLGQAHGGNGALPEITNLHTGRVSSVTNTATTHYLRRIDKPHETVIIDVGVAYSRTRAHGPRKRIFQSESLPGSKLSTLLYGLGPALTLVATVMLVLIRDWWGVGLVVALVVARALNVWIIRERTLYKHKRKRKHEGERDNEPSNSGHLNEHQCWWVRVDESHRICLRGLRHDLEAITTGEWMRSKTDFEGYLEAMAKLIVYLVAVFSGNQTQTGDIILMVLLGSSAALLALSNTFATSFKMNGRTAVVTPQEEDPKRESTAPTPTDPNKYTSNLSDFEKQEAAAVLETTYPFSNEVNYV